MNSRTALAIGAAMVIMFFAPVAHAYHGWGHGSQEQVCPRFYWDELNSEQRKQMQLLSLDYFTQRETTLSEIRKLKLEVKKMAAESSTYDEAAVEKKMKGYSQLKDNLRKQRGELATKFRSLLTVEQKAKIGPYTLYFGES
jgi:Spy/CpxP family protein refolding chaperone